MKVVLGIPEASEKTSIGIESVGRALANAISSAYYSLVKDIFSRQTMALDTNDILGCLALTACKLPLKVGDAALLQQTGLVEYLRPLLQFSGSFVVRVIVHNLAGLTGGSSEVYEKKAIEDLGQRLLDVTGKAKLAGWALFRLLCYRLANLYRKETDELTRLGAVVMFPTCFDIEIGQRMWIMS